MQDFGWIVGSIHKRPIGKLKPVQSHMPESCVSEYHRNPQSEPLTEKRDGKGCGESLGVELIGGGGVQKQG
jgi:hypothetical protein